MRIAARIARALGPPLAVILAAGLLPGVPLPRVRPSTLDSAPVVVGRRDGMVDVSARDGAGGPPLGGVHLRAMAVVDGRALFAGVADTGTDGHARLSNLPRGELWILADAMGRARASTRLVVGADPAAVTFELGPEHAFDALVTDDRGAPMADAEVEATSPSDPLPVGARCGKDGAAHLARLAAGPWRVVARAPGYEDAEGHVERNGESVALTLRLLSALVVRVLAASGASEGGARVAVAGATVWPPRVAETEADGIVRLGGLGAGTYALRATHGDAVSPIELGVTLERGETKSVDLRLAPGRYVSVRTADGDGDEATPIPGARLSLAEGGLSPFPIEATTAANGRARLGPIAPGPATLGARAEGYVARGALAVPDPPPVELRVVLVRAGSIVGRVVDARGDPVDGATLEIAGTDLNGGPVVDDPRRASFQRTHFEAMLAGPQPMLPAGVLGVVPGPVPPIPLGAAGLLLPASPPVAAESQPWVTRADGTFTASPVTPGRVRVVVRHPQYVEAQSEVVSLAPGGEARVDVLMREGGVLTGRVVDARDRPAAGAHVFVSATRGTMERVTRAASDGTFTFASLPETVSLGAAAAESDAPEVRLTLTIPEGGRQDVTVRLPEPRDPLPVQVVDERGRPVDAAQLTATSLAADVPLRATAFTDARGEAQIRGARGLALRVEARAPGRAPKVVAADPAGDSLRIELGAGETATGEVVADRRRDPIAGAEVTLYTEVGARRATTDRDGAFTLEELAPGPARLRVWASGFAAASLELTIPESGGRRPFAIDRVQLAASGTAEGTVVDAQGAPVAGARVALEHAPTWLVVGANPVGVATTDPRGRFSLSELPEGTVKLEAYAPDLGRARAEVTIAAGRTTDGVRLALEPVDAGGAHEVPPPGGVAVTLGETSAPVEVVVASVVEGSEAERAGLAPGDTIVTVDGAAVHSMEDARACLSGPLAADVVVNVRRGDRVVALRVPREVVRR